MLKTTVMHKWKYTCIAVVEISLSRRKGCNWGSIDRINSATLLCLSLTNNLIFNERIALSYLSKRFLEIQASRGEVFYHVKKNCIGNYILVQSWLLFAHSVVQHILNTVFALLFFVLYTLCWQFLWIIQFWLPLRYSPTFISLCQSYRYFFTELIQYTYDICHDYYLYDKHRDQD